MTAGLFSSRADTTRESLHTAGIAANSRDLWCRRVDAQTVGTGNPYWKQHCVTPIGPDGFQVVLVARSWDSH
jgi:hypothetical protein